MVRGMGPPASFLLRACLIEGITQVSTHWGHGTAGIGPSSPASPLGTRPPPLGSSIPAARPHPEYLAFSPPPPLSPPPVSGWLRRWHPCSGFPGTSALGLARKPAGTAGCRWAQGLAAGAAGGGSAGEGGLRGADFVERATRKWLDEVVIGLRLCPWAKGIVDSGGVRVVVSEAETEADLMDQVEGELELLAAVEDGVNATTLVVTERMLGDFFDFNEFAGWVDEVLEGRDLQGILQVATFHPDYQFGDTAKTDPENWTNRSPFPTLHLLREEEISRAVEGYPDTDKIWQRNKAVMKVKGCQEMQDLMAHCLREEGQGAGGGAAGDQERGKSAP